MSKMVLNPEFELYEREKHTFCDSLQIAHSFGKRHDRVLRAIQDQIEILSSVRSEDLAPQNWGNISVTNQIIGFAEAFCKENFVESTYKDRGKVYLKYLLSKVGFAYTTLGFTGKKAAIHKMLYTARFDAMEKRLATREVARLEYAPLTRAISEAHESPQHYHYSTEADLLNIVVTGKRARDIRSELGLDKKASIRDYLSSFELEAIEELQRFDTALLNLDKTYEERKELLTNHFKNKISARIAA